MSSTIVCRIHTPQLQDIPELIHNIQSLLPAKEAARTCILSKSWLHAWSIIPTLRFQLPQYQSGFAIHEKLEKYQEAIDHTLQRYHRDNISIECLDLQLHIQNQKSAFAAEKWILPVVSKRCLKELSFKLWVPTLNYLFTMPDELFSSENLSRIKVRTKQGLYHLRICSNPVIKCVTLRVLDLQSVEVTEAVVHSLLSTCTLLEKIKLWSCSGVKNVMVKNLRHLRKLVISSVNLEIKDVPSLCLFHYQTHYWGPNNHVPFKTDSLVSVAQLSITGVIVDEAFLDIIKSKAPLLEKMALEIGSWGLESLVITSASLKSLTLNLFKHERHVDVNVYAPKLLSFTYTGDMHGLRFPTIAPREINLNYFLSRPLDISFLLKLREVLNSSSKFKIYIDSRAVPSNIDIVDLRRRCSLPVKNFHKLQLGISLCAQLRKNIRFYDAFFMPFFSIFHPCHISSTKVVVREMRERQPTDLKDIELNNPFTRRWETLTSSSTSILDALNDSDSVECKLNWVSQ